MSDRLRERRPGLDQVAVKMGALIDRELRRALCVLICTALLMSPPVTAQTRSAGLPSLGDGEMTLGAERRMGERVAREIYRDPDFIDDPILGVTASAHARERLGRGRGRFRRLGLDCSPGFTR